MCTLFGYVYKITLTGIEGGDENTSLRQNLSQYFFMLAVVD